MCIYYLNRSGLNYDNQEHIIPAGIGGIKKLPKGYVSDEFNSDISKLETEFIRESWISALREAVGPGHRGKLADKFATKSKIQVFIGVENGSYSLGYTQKGKPFLISHFVLNVESHEGSLGFANSDAYTNKQTMATFFEKCSSAENLKIRNLYDKRLPKNIVLFGIQSGIEKRYDAFFAQAEGGTHRLSIQQIKMLAGIDISNREQNTSKSQQHLQKQMPFKDDYFRIYAKIAFNFLAQCMGEEFVRQDIFNAIRNWIVNGGEQGFTSLGTRKPFNNMGIPVPERAHYILITRADNFLVAHVSLYGGPIEVILTDKYVGNFQLQGLICDWEQRNEVGLYEYLNKLFPPQRIQDAI